MYVYVILDNTVPGPHIYGELKFNFLPIYVGQGRSYRAQESLHKLKQNIHQNHSVIFIITEVSKVEALKEECRLIKLIGVRSNSSGPLTNSIPITKEVIDNNYDPSETDLLPWLINPHYNQKPHLHPHILFPILRDWLVQLPNGYVITNQDALSFNLIPQKFRFCNRLGKVIGYYKLPLRLMLYGDNAKHSVYIVEKR